ncbi:SDR family oxidoreductase [Aquabacterium sp.]|uniref:SDR family oxidoreductase n=1 Tax=Aquabacterium sp. TaxID=1872578 RepID=UPI003784B5C3
MSSVKTFADKVIMVTGAGAGIGRCTALALAGAGAKLLLGDIDADGLAETARLAREAGADLRHQVVDVTRADAVHSLIDAGVHAFGRLDGAFNNAGIEVEHHRLADGDEAMFDRIMAINVKGVWLCMKHQLPLMVQQGGGAIVNTASVAGLVGAPLRAAYAASKHAVVGLTKSAAAEYGRRGVRINTVCPGIIHTAMMERALARRGPNEAKRDPGDAALMGRVGQPQEVAAAVL